jgi:hypothetical protein
VEGAEPVLPAALKPIAGSMRSCGFSTEADIAMGAHDADAAQLQQAGNVRISYCPAHPCRSWMCCCAYCMPNAVHGCSHDCADDKRAHLTVEHPATVTDEQVACRSRYSAIILSAAPAAVRLPLMHG